MRHRQSLPTEPLPFYFKDSQLSLPCMTSERGAGGAVSTMADTLRFLRRYFAGALFDRAHLDKMMRWTRCSFPCNTATDCGATNCPVGRTCSRNPRFHRSRWRRGRYGVLNPENDLYIVGTLNQMDNPSRQFRLLPKVVNLVTSA